MTVDKDSEVGFIDALPQWTVRTVAGESYRRPVCNYGGGIDICEFALPDTTCTGGDYYYVVDAAYSNRGAALHFVRSIGKMHRDPVYECHLEDMTSGEHNEMRAAIGELKPGK